MTVIFFSVVQIIEKDRFSLTPPLLKTRGQKTFIKSFFVMSGNFFVPRYTNGSQDNPKKLKFLKIFSRFQDQIKETVLYGWHQNRGSSIWGSRDIKRFRTRYWWRNVNFFRFLYRLPYFPFYRTIFLNVEVKIGYKLDCINYFSVGCIFI